MSNRKYLFILLFIFVQNSFAQNDVKEIKKCINGYIYIPDLDGDKVREKLCLKKWSKIHNDEDIYDVVLILSAHKKEIKLSVTKNNSTAEEYYEVFEFKMENNPKFKKIKNKYGLRMSFNEKSSRIYYWNIKSKKLIELEETD